MKKDEQELKNSIRELVIQCKKLNINLSKHQNKIDAALESNFFHVYQGMRLKLMDLILKNN